MRLSRTQLCTRGSNNLMTLSGSLVCYRSSPFWFDFYLSLGSRCRAFYFNKWPLRRSFDFRTWCWKRCYRSRQVADPTAWASTSACWSSTYCQAPWYPRILRSHSALMAWPLGLSPIPSFPYSAQFTECQWPAQQAFRALWTSAPGFQSSLHAWPTPSRIFDKWVFI